MSDYPFSIYLYTKEHLKILDDMSLIQYFMEIRYLYDNGDISFSEREQGFSEVRGEANYRINRGLMRWPAYPDYRPLAHYHKAIIVTDDAPLPKDAIVMTEYMAKFDLDPLANLYKVNHEGTNKGYHLYEYQIAIAPIKWIRS